MKAPIPISSLHGLNLCNSKLSGVQLEGGELLDTSLLCTDLSKSTLKDLTLKDSDLTNTNLQNALVMSVDLTNVTLIRAYMQNTLLLNTKLLLKQLPTSPIKIFVDINTLHHLGIPINFNSTFFSLSRDKNWVLHLKPLPRKELIKKFTAKLDPLRKEEMTEQLLKYNANEPKYFSDKLKHFSQNSCFLQLGKNLEIQCITIDNTSIVIYPAETQNTAPKMPDIHFKFR